MSGYELAILDDWRLKEKMKYERKLALPHKTDGFKIQNDLKSTCFGGSSLFHWLQNPLDTLFTRIW